MLNKLRKLRTFTLTKNVLFYFDVTVEFFLFWRRSMGRGILSKDVTEIESDACLFLIIGMMIMMMMSSLRFMEIKWCSEIFILKYLSSKMIYFLIVVFYFATAVVAHPLKNVIANPKFLQHSMVLQHSALLNTMNGSFPSDPSYLIMQISSDSHCAQTSALGYASYLLNQCLTTDSSSSMFITCGKRALIRIW